MTQTVNGQNNTPQKQSRPGRRQQERQMRIERRRRRRLIWMSVIIALVVIAGAGVTYWQYQRIISQPSAASAAKKTATHIGPVCSTASASPAVYASTPGAGPTNPPPVTGTPATNSDGLQCIDLQVGSGTIAQPGSTVSVQYTGWLASNGKKFDSSYDHGAQPFSVTPLGSAQVIPGWNEGLVGMKTGGTRRLILPATLAYGAQGSPPSIPPNAVLIFDITALSVN